MKPELLLSSLAARHPGLSAGIARSYEEAARVCLDRHHTPPVDFRMRDNDRGCEVTVDWIAADVTLSNAWANVIDATEFGAYGVALATVELLRGLVAVRRAETSTGVDYYVDFPGASSDDLENALRLEVSGMSEGTTAKLESRLQRKLRQAAAGDSNLPAAAIVVGFGLRTVVCADLRSS